MGEGRKPELVTVTPLTRGTGNQSGPTVSSDGRFGGGQPIVIENIITLDGQVIDRKIRKNAYLISECRFEIIEMHSISFLNLKTS